MESLARRLRSILPSYLNIAWSGLVAPHLSQHRPQFVHQGAVLSERGILLSVRRDLRGWELPGGNGLPGESGVDAVVREVLEETGVTATVERHVADYVRTGFRPHTACIYACRYVSGEPRPSEETPVVRWFGLNALPSTLFPWYRGPIADVLAQHDDLVVRHEYQGVRAVMAGMAIDLRMRAGGDR